MKKKVELIIAIVFLTATAVSAADLTEVGTGLSVAGGAHIDSSGSGGFGEIGFPLKRAPEAGGFEVRNYFSIFGFGNSVGEKSEESGTIMGQYKITFGGLTDKTIISRNYGFLGAGAGIGIQATGVEFIWGWEAGGGSHIYLNTNYLLIIEVGGGARSVYGNPLNIKGYGFIRVSMGGIWF